MVGLRLVADSQPLRVRRNTVVIVAMSLLASIDGRGRASGNRQSQDAPFFVKDKIRAVMAPVRRFKVARIRVDYAAIGRSDYLVVQGIVLVVSVGVELLEFIVGLVMALCVLVHECLFR